MRAVKFFIITVILSSAFLQTYSQTANDKLFESIKKGDVKLAAEALKEGADVNLTDKSNSMPVLMLTITFGQIETAKLLIEKGADVNITDAKGNTPLLIACANNRVEIIKPLLEKGADPDKENSNRHNSISKAVSKKFYDTAKLVMNSNVPFKLTPHLFAVVARTKDENLILLLKEKSVHTAKDDEKFDKLLIKLSEEKQKKAALEDSKKGKKITRPIIASAIIAVVAILGTTTTFIILRKRKTGKK